MAHPLRTAPLYISTALAAISLTTSSSSYAQPAPASATLASANLEPAAPPAPPTPPTITVDDPLLTPIPPAPKTLTTWQEAIQLIDTRAPDLRVAEEEVARAAGASRVALGRILPTLNATATATHQVAETEFPTGYKVQLGKDVFEIPKPYSSTNTTNTGTLAANLSIPVVQPRLWFAYGTARQSVELAKLSAVDRRRVLVTNVAAAIVSVFTAERVSEINRVGLRTALERLELTRRRTRLGTGTRLDVVRAEQDVTLATNTLVQANESLRRARETLGLAMGEDVPYGVAPNISLNAIENSVRTMCVVGKAEDRADVRAAAKQLEINRRQVRETQLGFLPTATVEAAANTGLNGQLSASTINSVLPVPIPPSILQPATSNYTWSIRAVLTIPIFDGTRYGELAVNRALSEQQRARVEAAARQARLEITQANRAVEVAEQSRANSEAARDLAKETARLTQVAYEAGTATSFELVDASRRQRETENDLVVKEFDLLKAKVAALLAAAVCEE